MTRRRHATPSRKALSLLTVGLAAGLLSACADAGDADEAESPQEGEATALETVAGPTASAAVFRCSGDRIALRAAGGQFVSVVDDVLGGLVAEARTPSDSETFLVYAVGPNQVALRARNGWFVAVVGSSLFTTARSMTSDTVFTVTPHWNGAAWALQTRSGTFVTAERGGGSVVNVSRRSVGDWQAFTAVCLSTSWTAPAGPTATTPPGQGGWDQPLPPTGIPTTTPPGGGTVAPPGTATTTPPWNGTVPPAGTPTPPWSGTAPGAAPATTPPWGAVPPTGNWTP